MVSTQGYPVPIKLMVSAQGYFIPIKTMVSTQDYNFPPKQWFPHVPRLYGANVGRPPQ